MKNTVNELLAAPYGTKPKPSYEQLLEALEFACQYLGRAVAEGQMETCVIPASRALDHVEAVIAAAKGGR
jgi:hypothetical protein